MPVPPQLKRCRRTNLTLDSCERRVLADKVNVIQAGLKSPVQTAAPRSSSRRVRKTSANSQISFAKARVIGGTVERVPPASIAQQLPADVLVLILLVGAAEDDELPVVGSQVCFHWRRVAISCPFLWCKLRPDGRVNLWRSRISRRRSLPLDIQIDDGPRAHFHNTPSLAHLHNQLSSTLPLLSSWRSLSIHISSRHPYLWNILLSKLCNTGNASNAPLLRRLSLVYPANDDDKEFHLFGDQAPNLQDVRLHGIRLRWTPRLFGNLVHLDYVHQVVTSPHDAVQEVLAMLATSSRLQTLSVGFQYTTRHSPSSRSVGKPIQSVSLVNLKKLTLRLLRDDSRHELLVLVKKLKLPSLVELQFTNDARSCLPQRLLAELFRPFRWHQSLRSVSSDETLFFPRQFYGFVFSLPVLKTIVIASAPSQHLRTFERLLGQQFRIEIQKKRSLFYRQ